jgi:predicted phosphoserine aminotransferase
MRLFIPGPTDVALEVLEAQNRPMIGHRSQEFYDLFSGLQPRLQRVFQTEGRVLVSAASGTGLQEAAVRNLVAERLLMLTCGAFGERWFNVAQSNGVAVDQEQSAWGTPNTVDQLEQALSSSQYDAVALVHNETSTGVENPIAALAQRARQIQPDIIIMVDAVSSAGGVEIRADEWGLDLVLTSSQKCLALPPGLAFACLSDRGLERAASVSNRGWYFDLVKLEKYRVERKSTPATPAVSLLYALDRQLDRMLAEGLPARFARHTLLAERTRAWAEHRFGLFAAEGSRSRTVTTILKDPPLDFSALNSFLAQRGMRIANGYGRLKEETFRVGHMGEVSIGDLEDLLASIDDFLDNR